MKLQQLQTLVAVVEHGGIRAAARQLNVSQAAVTKSMRLLEEEALVPLLLRRSRGVDLTEAGQRLLTRARLITRQVALAGEDLRQAGGEDAGSLQVGVNPFVTLTVLGEAFTWFRQRYSQVQVEFSDGLMVRVLPRLRNGTLDLAVVAADAGEVLGDEFHVQRLQLVRQRVVVRRGHPVLQAPTPAALVQYEWIVTRPLDSGLQPLAGMFAAAGVARPERIMVCDALQAFALQRHSDAISVMPDPLLGNPETREIVPVENSGFKPHDLEVLVLTRPDVPLTPAAAYFAHCVVQTAQKAF